MCGICGVLSPEPNLSASDLTAEVRRMAMAIQHRGPDADGAWVDEAAGVALGHRRLSILDLSAAGAQPMASDDERFQVVFNGEIYNFEALRRDLGGASHRWRGHSDTEVMLAAFSRWGVRDAVARLEGMFAIACWDRRERTLWLARDRGGEKPLYWGWHGGRLLFGSELKALAASRGWSGRLDRAAVSAYLRFGYVPAPWSIYAGIQKLPAGHVVAITPDVAAARRLPASDAYWRLSDVVAAGRAAPFTGTRSEAVDQLETLLRDAIGRQMVADVPLGAFLSGGVDSSTVVALMQAQSSRPVRTFSIGFTEPTWNEAPYAKAVAEHLGTDHTELYVTPAEALAVIPQLPHLYDEPFADSSQIPTYLVSQLARRHVTVALSGDAGDELFGGYQRYFLGADLWRKIQRIPTWGRRALRGAVHAVPPNALSALLVGPAQLLPRRFRRKDLGQQLHKVADAVGAGSSAHFYRGFASIEHAPSTVTGVAEAESLLDLPASWPGTESFTGQMMALDFLTYLPDDILVKVDRAAMATSLETRVPLLDPRVIAFAWSLPESYKVQASGKLVLRDLLDRHVPRRLTDRPKMGFGVPIDEWLRGPLRDWAEALLSPAALARHGLLDPARVRQEWDTHLTGARNRHPWLWTVLMLQAWLDDSGAVV